jgi:hypothetical protein
MSRLDLLNTALVTTTPIAAPRAARPGRRIGRRVGAVLAGLAVNVVLASAVDAALHATHVYPSVGERMADALFLLAFAYRVVFGVAGSYLTARLAPDRPVAHALALGALGVAIGIVGAAVMWGAGPAWYSLGIIAVTPPAAWIGGQLRARQRRAR